ncbi:MAG TPA: glycoside hydrolase family 3 protein, partial [Polyangia bacterium]
MHSSNNLFGRILLILAVFSLALSACQPSGTPLPTLDIPTLPFPAVKPTAVLPTLAPTEPVPTQPPSTRYKDASLPLEQRAADLLGQMTLAEKIGQMTQIEINSIPDPKLVTQKLLGSVLSGGDGQPKPNTPENWVKMVSGVQQAALQTRLGIPLLYGIDAVHGHNAVYGAVVYPHNIGLGAAGDPALVAQIGRATAEEMTATGILWNFAPVLAVVQDIRWGRTYESYGENTDLVTRLGTAYVQGLQGVGLSAPSSVLAPAAVLASLKHFIGDGGTAWGSSTSQGYKLDQGDVQLDDASLRKLFLPPYKAAIDAGALNVMASFSSVRGTKMHANKVLLTDLLKGELGFQGFVVSDWGGVDQVASSYSQAVAESINAGVDMVMVPYDANKFITTLTAAVASGAVLQARIDDAVGRILWVKFKLGLFDERPPADASLLGAIGSDAHRQLARQAVAKSLVLLKNDAQALPLSKAAPLILVAGQAADDIGIQCGGWTMGWQGQSGAVTAGTTLLKGIQAAASGSVQYNRYG